MLVFYGVQVFVYHATTRIFRILFGYSSRDLGRFPVNKKVRKLRSRNKVAEISWKTNHLTDEFRQFQESSEMERKFPVRNFGLPRKVVLFSRNPEKCCSTSVVWKFREINLVRHFMLILSFVPRPSHARFSKWWLVRRRSRLGHVTQYMQKILEIFYHILKLEKALGTRLRLSCSRHMRPYLETFSTTSSRFGNSFPFHVFLFSVYTYFLEVFLTDSLIAMTLTAINWCCRGRFEIFYSKKKPCIYFISVQATVFPQRDGSAIVQHTSSHGKGRHWRMRVYVLLQPLLFQWFPVLLDGTSIRYDYYWWEGYYHHSM